MSTWQLRNWQLFSSSSYPGDKKFILEHQEAGRWSDLLCTLCSLTGPYQCEFPEDVSSPVSERRGSFKRSYLNNTLKHQQILKTFGYCCFHRSIHRHLWILGWWKLVSWQSWDQGIDTALMKQCGLPSVPLSNHFHGPFASRVRSSMSLLVLSAENLNEQGK